ncbi:molecular chaperone [Vibrio splendidus]|uniref:fimbrial biogenesis chaperone n=1 Tax=Vibrio splendidus TaxID=29497 RepID=UPI000C847DFE|nr:fimbria/pilus periplasmic chaperone [Vibrio splendidus]PMO97766.1 pilus assembly protein PapD [Vibrio splendidus]PMP26418.1 pilus assembly protein PapD [Vibrio splendidus]PMP33446.1 pilus assembly protein PapD [Vibrio splendidus]PMP38626.1 pilus assembly protein PapD [Vibrio splendidus]PMP55151.1 pilus assembly protein PapD [Vibrio splendidus]
MTRIITLLFSLFFSSALFAYEVSPIYLELDDVGRNAQGLYKVTNVEEEPILLEVNVYQTDFSTGEEILTPTEDEFLVLPPQAKIDGLKSQTFRVRYMPTGPIKQTVTYRIVFSQIELENQIEEDEDSSISMLLEFATLVFVSPTSSKSIPTTTVQNSQVAIRNDGKRVLNMNGMEFSFSGGKANKTVDWEVLSKKTSAYLMPGTTIKYTLPSELGQPKKVSVKTID